MQIDWAFLINNVFDYVIVFPLYSKQTFGPGIMEAAAETEKRTDRSLPRDESGCGHKQRPDAGPIRPIVTLRPKFIESVSRIFASEVAQ